VKTKKKPTARKKPAVKRDADAEIRKLKKEVKLLREKLAKACDLALDAAEVIEDDGIGVDEEETQDLRDMIMSLREYAHRPEAERHVGRKKEVEERELATVANPVADQEGSHV
jgi:hypothetical protein